MLPSHQRRQSKQYAVSNQEDNSSRTKIPAVVVVEVAIVQNKPALGQVLLELGTGGMLSAKCQQRSHLGA